MMMMSVTTECAIPASNTNGFQTLKGEHQVRYDDGMTPDQTITDGAEPNSKLTAKMSVPGHSRPMHSVSVPINVRCYSNSDIIVRRSEVTLRAMCGRLRVGKDFFHECSIGRCGHVFGLLMRFT
jgi:hypothetical protein